ncbi:sensor histidine kinase [Paenibacillus polysaccharolyticus]|uniref:Oxygen sensor histidine kinase NreB n=2 Tax=Paenibacillus TaxID=44249 RepID=A0A1G5I4J4_9BACL|nr:MULTISPECIES: sensor histidine kinase [Paenibacillus]MBY0201647.1 sensor histidine kinase [Paenibacillus cucumis (ex Kampfer et al. 2016)]MCP1135026.1 sensor histidine kinase [Paenibacillus polysaccharolyticus]MDP9698946.1 signal transduction histidine kinase [Paenibacillus intestini]SCY70947.1 Histidine kinase-, DNA gyrase B-, and HSP90-like ATPase [Paenibacillus polysaccharolyticus]
MIRTILKANKWELMTYFVLTGLITLGGFYLLYGDVLTGDNRNRAWTYIGVVVVGTVVTGYIAALRLQRKIDLLDLNMLKVSKGNLAVRMPDAEDASFGRVYQEFNVMMESIEKKMRLLQRLGEQEVIEKEQASERAVIEERKRMARDLHDTVSQQLFAMHMSASSLPRLLEMNPEHGRNVLDQLIQMSHIAQRQMRGLIAQLRPIELEGRDLTAALDSWFPDYCRQNGLKGVKELELDGGVSDAIEHQLFLIIQEAVANVVKHAEAGLVSLAIRESEHQISMSISDDGQGFLQQTERPGSYGLSTMRERAEKLGGQVQIISKPGAGTTVRVLIPKFDNVSEEESE